MSTILSKLTQRTTEVRNAADKASFLSLESDIVELTEQVDAGTSEVQEVSEQISEASANIDTSAQGADSLSALVDNTVAIYGETGIPEDAAKQLEVSVECVLRVMGHPGGFSTVLPSFESCTGPANYSTEAEEKKNGVVQRIWAWIQKVFGQMAEFLTGMIDKIRNNTANLTKLSGKLKEKVNKLEGADATGNVSLGGYGKFCNPSSPAQALTTSKSNVTSFVHKWEEFFGGIFSNDLTKEAFKNPETAGEALVTLMMAEQKKLPEWSSVPVTAFHVLSITKGTDTENPMIGAKAKIEPTHALKDAEHPALSKATMLQVLGGVDELIAELDYLSKDFGKYRDNLKMVKRAGFTQRVGGKLNGMAAKDDMHKELANQTSRAGRVLDSLARMGIDGLSQSVPAVMDVIRANLTYVNKSANAHGKAKAAEKTDA